MPHVVHARSEIDPLSCLDLIESLEVPGKSDVELDCCDIVFIDSSGLLALVEAQAHLASEGRQLILRNPSRPLARLLELTEMVDRFEIRQS